MWVMGLLGFSCSGFVTDAVLFAQSCGFTGRGAELDASTLLPTNSA